MCDVIYILLRNSTQPTLQPLHHQPISLTNGGDRAMDDTGGDRYEALVRVRPSQKGESEEENRTGKKIKTQ